MSNDDLSIMEFSEDLATAEPPQPLPAGEYPAEITKAVIALSKTSGLPMLVLNMYITPESYPADFTEGDPDGTTLVHRVMLADTAQGRYRVRRFNESVGAKNGRSVDPNEYMGLTAMVGIVHEAYEGVQQAKISKVMSA